MIELHPFDWLEAPGVGDPVLAKTWMRLGLRVDGREVIQYFDQRTRSVRSGVYGSVFPLVSWLVENWWNLLYEPPIAPRIFEGARSPQRDPEKQRSFLAWMRRHNLLFAREGMALPDLSIFRDEDRVMVHWTADPEAEGRGRFIGSGRARLEREAVERCFRELVTTVLQWLEDQEVECDEVADMQANWQAIMASQASEPELCQALAALGEDPYDPDEINEELIRMLRHRVFVMEPSLQHDLLGGTTHSTLEEDCECVERLEAPLRSLNGHAATPWGMPAGLPLDKSAWPHQDGYRRAEYLRCALLANDRGEPIADLSEFITSRLGEFIRLESDCPARRIDGLVAYDSACRRVLVTPGAVARPATSTRFLEGRALHQWLFTIGNQPMKRLITRSHEWEQRASRAFAASFLAPPAAIQKELDRGQTIESIAAHFGVSEYVIVHQIQNHRLDAPECSDP